MKRFCMLIVLAIIAVAAYTQQSTTLYFTDKNGLQDSLSVVIGLSDEEIAAIPVYTPAEAEQEVKDSVHWVWLCTGMYPGSYKREYAYKPYKGNMGKAKEWIFFPDDRIPVSISWDKQFFINNDLKHSYITDWVCEDAVCGGEEIHYLLLTSDDSCILQNTYPTAECTFDWWRFDGICLKVLTFAVGTSENDIFEDINNIPASTSSASKILREGQLYILRGDHIFDTQGKMVR
jgi:hypothetical protein